MKNSIRLLPALFFCLSIMTVFGQIRINEVSNANLSNYNDEEDGYPDWIELYNAGATAVNLKNYALSDNEKKPDKWVFPEVLIAPDSFLVVFASGKDTVIGKHIHANFKISSEGEDIYLSNNFGLLIDNVNPGSLQMGHSIGRKPDGSANWLLFETPSPKASNNNTHGYLGYEPDPVFSIKAGFYPSAQTVEISSASPTSIVRYTLDGTLASGSSPVYSGPIQASNTIAVSAKSFSSGNRLPSRMVKNTYFINDNEIYLPVISITMDPKDLWDSSTGIYTNFTLKDERLCHMEYFDKQKIKQAEVTAGIRLQGNYSRNYAQKSFRIFCRKEYGASTIDFPFFTERPDVNSFKRLTIRNAGNDYSYTRFRDPFMQRLMKVSPLDRMEYEPVVLFLNGEYWGTYQLREHHSKHYIETMYGVDKDNIDLLYHRGNSIRAQEGDTKEFTKMYNYVMGADHNSPDFYENVNQKLDLENFADYMACEIFYTNEDWIDHTATANNIRIWREKVPDAKFRYMLWDLDYGCGLKATSLPTFNTLDMVINPNENNVHSDLLRKLLSNKEFHNYFVNRYADLMNTALLQENMAALANEMRDSLRQSMPRHRQRWPSSIDWSKAVDKLIDWTGKRLPYARAHVNDQFSLKGQVEISLKVFPEGAGKIKISTITPDSLPWKGIYYNGVPVTITVIPNPGYTFDYWAENKTLKKDFNKTITVDVEDNDTFVAHFTATPKNPNLTITEINYHSHPEHDSGDWLELHNYGNVPVNLYGWALKNNDDSNVFEIPEDTWIQPGAYMVFVTDSQKFKSQHPDIKNIMGELPFKLKNTGDQVRFFDYDMEQYLAVTYKNVSPWPKEAGGLGRTLELKDYKTNIGLSSNWFAGCPGGSPGRAFEDVCEVPEEEKEKEKEKEKENDPDPGITIKPNPSSGSMMVEIIMDDIEPEDISMEIYNMTGTMVMHLLNLQSKSIKIEREALGIGTYLLKINLKDKFVCEKLIFQ